MLKIGKPYICAAEGGARLCADVSLESRGTTLWFSVEKRYEKRLSADRADAFVMALLPMAMRSGQDIACGGAMSERLRYQLNNYLIPTLASLEMYESVRVHAPLAAPPASPAGAVGTGFSGGVDSLYTVLRHGAESPLRLTHLAVFDAGVFESGREAFEKACRGAERFAAETGLETVFVDTNLPQALPERFLDVYSFRNLACALALQGLFSVYLLSSGHDFANFSLDGRNSASYDLLTVSCAATESMAVYLSGGECPRGEKLRALAQWEPSRRWLHPCIYGYAGEQNCGACKKCVRDMTTLYALDALELYRDVFDIPKYMKMLPQRIGFVLANRGNHLYDETVRLLAESGKSVPRAAFECEKQFRAAMKNLEAGK